jgi:hypothetical protein
MPGLGAPPRAGAIRSLARILKAKCPECGAKFTRRTNDESGDERAVRLELHRGSKGCKANQLRAAVAARGLMLMSHELSFEQGYHEIKDAGLIERHQTAVRQPAGVLIHEFWAPRWAQTYVMYLRAGRPRPPFQARVAELKALASDPDGPDRAKAFLALRGQEDDS